MRTMLDREIDFWRSEVTRFHATTRLGASPACTARFYATQGIVAALMNYRAVCVLTQTAPGERNADLAANAEQSSNEEPVAP